MEKNEQEFQLRLRSKILIGFLFAFVGIPMLYAAVLNVQVQQVIMGTVMIMLFMIWALVILKAIGYTVKLTDEEIKKEGVFAPSNLSFGEVEKIDFGSTFSSFCLQSDENKLYISNDFNNYKDLIQGIIDKVQRTKNLEEVTLSGNSDDIEKYIGEQA
ncbi:hypothetical protein LX73_1364 [Fodinibius salinus]|uniref:PH domain-containing protein n=1 Tax=Fodinibius salinus TaxID=860790 RepID=A0A5D3YJH0_9BACT|nr:hypothetical protein [Fodinibius salinus]TYP93655.1 hypothetical protein LX73_1364 [Fodinibius salinus]